MFRFMKNQLHGDDGIGVVLAIVVSFIVFSLGATWFALASHELDEVTFDRHRTQSLASADSGARTSMSWLSNDYLDFRTLANDTGSVDMGITGGKCDVQQLTTWIDGVEVLQGEYWSRATSIGDDRYEIEAWGWAPSRTARQSVLRKIEFDVDIIPLGGFRDALFASAGGFDGSQRKVVYGNAYSGNDVTITNNTEIHQNEAPHVGDGSLSVYGNLEISPGSNSTIEGDVNVQGQIQDTKGSNFLANVYIRADASIPGYTSSYFNNAIVEGEIKTAGLLDLASSFFKIGSPPVEGATDLVDVLEVDLPKFIFNPADYPVVTVHADAAAFNLWIKTNKTTIQGVHHVLNGGDAVVNFHRAEFLDHTMVVIEKSTDPTHPNPTGSVTITGTPAAGTTPEGDPATVVIAMTDTDGTLALSRVFSVPDEVHHLIYSNGAFGATNVVNIYGLIYGFEDVSSNLLEVHFREPDPDLVNNAFIFDPRLADEHIAEPGIWNNVTNATRPITDYCDPSV